MQKGFAKGLKPLLIKRLALLIGICYLLNPLQKQISIVFHEVSHVLVVPDYIMSHDSNSSYGNNSHGHSDHQIDFVDHDHVIVDFVDSVFAASEENDDPADSILDEIKVDKHITTYEFQLRKYFSKAMAPEFWWSSEKLKLAHLKRLKEPPQFSKSQSV